MRYYFNAFFLIAFYFFIFILITALLGVLIKNWELNSFISYLIVGTTIVYYFSKYRKVYICYGSIKIKNLLFYLLLTIAFCYISYLINIHIYNFSSNINNFKFNFQNLTLLLICPFFEEIIIRGIVTEYLIDKKRNKIIVVLFTSILFGLGHLPNLESVFMLSFFSIILSVVYLLERNFVYLIIMHSVYNLYSIFIYN